MIGPATHFNLSHILIASTTHHFNPCRKQSLILSIKCHGGWVKPVFVKVSKKWIIEFNKESTKSQDKVW